MFNFLLILFSVVVCIIAVVGVIIPVVWADDIKKLMSKDFNEQLDKLEKKEVAQ